MLTRIEHVNGSIEAAHATAEDSRRLYTRCTLLESSDCTVRCAATDSVAGWFSRRTEHVLPSATIPSSRSASPSTGDWHNDDASDNCNRPITICTPKLKGTLSGLLGLLADGARDGNEVSISSASSSSSLELEFELDVRNMRAVDGSEAEMVMLRNRGHE